MQKTFAGLLSCLLMLQNDMLHVNAGLRAIYQTRLLDMQA